jgi:valyl-tRNA synthetase
MDKTFQEAVFCAQWWFFSFNKLDYLKMLDGEAEKLKDNYLLVATSRPETIFADVALFVNPQDERYQRYIGQEVQHPFTGKIIPILADENIKIDFGTGVLKCTPGHDLTDYELGKKYQLPIISCCDEKGTLNELTGQ